MGGFAVYRLPYAKQATLVRQTEGEPLELSSCQALNGQQGFVIAPFEITPAQPIILIRPDETECLDLSRSEKCFSRNVECGMWNENSSATDSATDSAHDSNLIPHSTFHIPQNPPQNPPHSTFHIPQYYSIDFANYHAQLENDAFRKIVLARCADEKMPEGGNLWNSFIALAHSIPDSLSHSWIHRRVDAGSRLHQRFSWKDRALTGEPSPWLVR